MICKSSTLQSNDETTAEFFNLKNNFSPEGQKKVDELNTLLDQKELNLEKIKEFIALIKNSPNLSLLEDIAFELRKRNIEI